MTKRLFAIVLAAILAITMFTFPVAAAANVNASLEPDGTRLKLQYTAGSNVEGCNKVIINYLKGTAIAKTVTYTSTSDLKKDAHDFATSTGGEYTAQVFWYNGNIQLATYTTRTVIVPITTTGSNMKVIYDGNGITLEFNPQSGATAYTAVYTYKSGNQTVNGQPIQLNCTVANNKVTCPFSAGVSYSDLVSIKLHVGTPSSYSTNYFASWGNTSSSGGTSSGGLTVQGRVTASISGNSIVGNINDYSYNYYRFGVSSNGSSYQYSNASTSRSFNYPLYNTSYYGLHIIVQGSTTSYGTWNTIGDISYNYNGGSGSGSGNVALNSYNGNLILSWAPVSGAIGYIIQYSGGNNVSGSQRVDANTTSWTVGFAAVTNSFTIDVAAIMPDNSYSYIGRTGSNYGNSYYPSYGGGQTVGGIVTQGSNCTVTSYSNYAYVQWTSSGSSEYVVLVYREGDTRGLTYEVSGGINFTQIPISNTYNYSLVVYNKYGSYAPIASATVKASANSTLDNINIKKTEIKNLRVTQLNSYTTSLSWDKVSGADCYVVTYGLLNGGIADEIPVYNGSTSITIPFGSNTAYQATVYAVSNSGRSSEVGHVYNVPGTTADNASTKDYPSNFTAKSSNKKINLSWKAADGASSYTIYYKRATSSSWLKVNQKITKTAVNISGLSNDIDYNFKVVTNTGNESGVVTIAPSASTSRTVTAKDPSSSSSNDGDINLDEDELTVTSVSSTSKGKIKITWSNVGAPSYKIYVAEGTSNSYKPCGTYTGTSATISTFGTGSSATSFKSGKTYKVRIVRTDYTGSIKDALKACPYKTVTVK